MHNTWTDVIVADNRWVGIWLGCGVDPHASEGGQGCKDGSSEPHGDHTLWWCDDLNLGTLGDETFDLGLETLWHVWEHGGTARHDDVTEEILADVKITVIDSLLGKLVQTHHLLTVHGWLEHKLWTADDLVVHSDNRHVRKLEGLLLACEVVDFLSEVHRHVAEVLFDLLGCLPLSGGDKVDLGLCQYLVDVLGQVLATLPEHH